MQINIECKIPWKTLVYIQCFPYTCKTHDNKEYAKKLCGSEVNLKVIMPPKSSGKAAIREFISKKLLISEQ